MTAYEILALTIEASNRLDTSWALFLSIHAALFGGIVYIDRPLRRAEKCVLIPAYFAVAVYNFYLTRNSQQMLRSLYQDLEELQIAEGLNLHVIEYFESFSRIWSSASHTSVTIVHSVALVVVVIAVVLDGRLKDTLNSGTDTPEIVSKDAPVKIWAMGVNSHASTQSATASQLVATRLCLPLIQRSSSSRKVSGQSGE